MTLYDLKINDFGKIISINCDKNLKQRLLDLGLTLGTIISPVFVSPLGDPIAYEWRGNIIAIRKKEAQNIIIDTSF